MTRSKFSIKAALLAGGIGLSMPGFAGSQPAAAQSYSNQYSCPAGFVYDVTYGCTLPGDAYGSYDFGDYGYLPYGTDGSYYAGHREFGHGLGHGIAGGINHSASATVLRGSPSQGLDRLGDDGFNHSLAGGISNVDQGPGFAHFGGGGFDHGIGAEGTIVHHGMGFHSIGVAHFGGGGFSHGIGGGFNRGVGFAHAGGFGAFHGGGGFGGFHGGGGFGGGGHR
jgi:hypothetical protein